MTGTISSHLRYDTDRIETAGEWMTKDAYLNMLRREWLRARKNKYPALCDAICIIAGRVTSGS